MSWSARPASGKTTTGAALAELLGVPFRDTDADIEQQAGKPIPDIFIDDGEEHFRALERAAVARALTDFDGVLALGGGAVLAEETRAALRGHTVVFLSVGLAEAVKRIGLGQGRPLLAVNPRATLRAPDGAAATSLPGSRHPHRGHRRADAAGGGGGDSRRRHRVG